ncbi:MAG TPA: hypothetical protein VM101_03550 [Flavitalea sp.]|nr:hypothetical protein [Flavitalea sp.]
MMQNQTLTKKPLADIGEEIGLELGVQLVNDYQVANPGDVQYYVIGRKIIEQILAQPGCVAIKFLYAYNEIGEKTLVYIGMNAEGQSILKFTSVNNMGQLSEENGIVADRADRGGGGSRPDADDWSWQVE